ncbi:hypothetical protein L9F63_027647, partial [Diploptera punctata]
PKTRKKFKMSKKPQFCQSCPSSQSYTFYADCINLQQAIELVVVLHRATKNKLFFFSGRKHINGVPYCKECAANLHWNQDLETCDYPGNVNCDAVPAPTTTSSNKSSNNIRPTRPPTTRPPTTVRPTRPPTTRPPTTVRPTRPPATIRPTRPPATSPPTTVRPTRPPITTTSDPTVCPPGNVPTCPFPDPAYSVFFPHENDCQWFYHCSNGVAYCKICPAGLHWNTGLNTCDYPYRAGCDATLRKLPKRINKL